MTSGADLAAAFAARFAGAPHAAARSPGRVNLIGEHTDYNGGLVLPAAIARETRVAVRTRGDGQVRGLSRERGAAEAPLAAPRAGDWLDYPRGVAGELAAAGRIPAAGFDLYVETDLPAGAGLSSSAALEAATALALLAAAGHALADADRPQLALLCQRAEVGFVGVPCGVMDQFAVLCGQPGAALRLDCARLEARAVALPEELAILIFDTGVERSLRAGAYAERRAECERARAQAEAALGRPLASLSELPAAELPALARALDPVALRRARHVASENQRVAEFEAALARGELAAAGAVLFDGHASLRDDFEVTCPESDALVADARELPGCVGARMTGAGFGGCTVQLVRSEQADRFAAALAQRFRARFGRTPRHWRTGVAPAASLVRF